MQTSTNTVTLTSKDVKLLMKEAIVEILTERQDLFMELIHEALEDVYMAKAIEEADDELVSEEEINLVLKS